MSCWEMKITLIQKMSIYGKWVSRGKTRKRARARSQWPLQAGLSSLDLKGHMQERGLMDQSFGNITVAVVRGVG